MRRRLLVTGAAGQLGEAVRQAAAAAPGIELIPASRRPEAAGWVALDLESRASIGDALERERPDAVLHLAAVTRPPWAEAHPAETTRVNRDGSAALAAACRARGARLVAVSTDLVFAGRDGGRYREDDLPGPLSVYAQSKLAGEQAVLAADPGALVVRTSLLLAAGRDHVRRLTEDLRGDGATLFTDEWRSPLLAADLAAALLELAATDAAGLLHLGGPEDLSRHELGLVIARALGLDTGRIRAGSRLAAPPPERPGDVTLDSSRGYRLLRRARIRGVSEAAAELRG